jgi:hypothetical protein
MIVAHMSGTPSLTKLVDTPVWFQDGFVGPAIWFRRGPKRLRQGIPGPHLGVASRAGFSRPPIKRKPRAGASGTFFCASILRMPAEKTRKSRKGSTADRAKLATIARP